MKKLKWIVSLILILIVTASCMFIANGAGSRYQPGDRIDDFTITAYDGRTFTLSEILEEKDMVVLNFWATWCGYCVMEFPHMEEAYQKYSDKVEIIAISCEPSDTDEVIADFAAEHGLSFPMSTDAAGLGAAFGISSYPTTVVIDRNGIMCFAQSGAVDSAATFENLFAFYTSDAYDEPRLLNTIPGTKPDAVIPDEYALSEALGGGDIKFYCDEFEYSWPMNVTEIDGRLMVESANSDVVNSTSYVYADFEASAGDAAVVTFKTSTEPAFDLMRITLDGEPVKSFSGEHDWMTYAVSIPTDGTHTLVISFEYVSGSVNSDNKIWIDSIELASGDAAAAAIAANPTYPVSDVTSLVPVNEGAQEVIIDEPTGTLNDAYDFYIINGETAEILVNLAPDYDPENVLILTNYDNSTWFPPEYIADDGYRITAKIDSLATTGYSFTALSVVKLAVTESVEADVFYFADENNLNAFLLDATGGAYGWYYADESTDTSVSAEEVIEGDSSYTLKAIDQDGNPVPGVMIQVCDASLCMVYTTEDNGMVTFELPAYEYEVHLLKTPEGYSGDTQTIIHTPATGGEVVIELTKN